MGNLARTYSDLGEHQKAKELQPTLLEKWKQVLGGNHPQTLLTIGNLASAYSHLGEHQKAKELKAIVLEKQNQFPLPTHSPSLHVSPAPPFPLQPSHAPSSLPPLHKLGIGLKKQTASVAVEPAPAGETKATRKHALQDNCYGHAPSDPFQPFTAIPVTAYFTAVASYPTFLLRPASSIDAQPLGFLQ
jgi:hypothetical protein